MVGRVYSPNVLAGGEGNGNNAGRHFVGRWVGGCAMGGDGVRWVAMVWCGCASQRQAIGR